MKVLGGFIVVQVDEHERQRNGVLIHEQWHTLPPTGEVIGVGEEVTKVKKGDRVHFMRFAAIDGIEKNQRVCREGDIIAIL